VARLGVCSLAVCLLVAGCGSDKPPLATLHRGGVQVRLGFQRSATGDALVATFRPDRKGFHLYSVDLDPSAAGGVGFPTRLDVRGGLTPQAAPVASAPVRLLRIATIGTLPVYPDGPVSLREPVRRTGDAAAEAILSYAACSDTVCLPPVVNATVRFSIPAAA
jgi:hypothetical protein